MLSVPNPTHTLNTVAVHMALLKSGEILAFGGDDCDIGNWNKGKSSIWNPIDHTSSNPILDRNLFCAGHCILPDGRIFTAGGQASVQPFYSNGILSFFGILPLIGRLDPSKQGADHDIYTFDPKSKKWTKHKSMPKARWYPTCITLPDGQALIVSGSWSRAHDFFFEDILQNIFKISFTDLRYEIFDPLTNTLSPPKPFLKKMKTYPFLQILPGGTLFVHFEDKTRLLNISNLQETPKEFKSNFEGTRTYPGMGCCTLLPLNPDDMKFKILMAGGIEDINPKTNSKATDSAEIFTFDSVNPDNSEWTNTNPTKKKRFLSDSVILPDGKILLVNGASGGKADDNNGIVKDIEIFDPESQSWSIHGILGKDRLYHSTTLLLPDGKVVVAGSTGAEWTNPRFEKIIEVISPPYLDNDPNRPEIISAPEEISYDESFEVNTQNSTNIVKTTIIRCSSITHNNNMDQRCVNLKKDNLSNNSLKIQSPKNSTWAPPGYYMLFVIDGEGIPSVGKIFKLS